jgi:bifunctional polynucleotide phosphatase/kinase
MSWTTLDATLFRLEHKGSFRETIGSQVAMFDLDSTLIIHRNPEKDRKSFAGIAKNETQWVYYNEDVIPKLEALAKSGAALIVITNQKYTKGLDVMFAKVQSVFIDIVERCSFKYVEFYVATGGDVWRKPNSTIFEKYIYPKLQDTSTIFYIGDAAGRPDDFSDSDWAFAYNIKLFLRCMDNSSKISFETPEEYFGQEVADKNTRTWRFDISKYYTKNTRAICCKLPKPCVVIMVGMPASGKTTYAELINKQYKSVEIIDKPTQQLCVKQAVKCMIDKIEIIIISKTNPKSITRKEFITAAKHREYNTVCIHFNLPRELCDHLNTTRMRMVYDKSGEHHKIPDVAYNVFNKAYEEPLEFEYDAYFRMDFIPSFKNKKDIMYFMQH